MAQAAVVASLEQQALENDLGVPLFLFCCFRTTGSNLHTDEISEMAVKCWPYQEEVPSFHYQILTRKTNFIASNCKKHGRFQHAVGELCRWMQKTVNQASTELNTQLYPVLFCHGGDSKDFLFFFRSCAKYGIDLNAASGLPIHFADPVPLLELLKVRRHPLLSDSTYLTLGSLLNDWYPGMFDPADLSSLPTRANFTSQLYTQTTLFPVLSRVPIYNIGEWSQYYNAALKYKEDKRELEAHMPNHIKAVQAKFAVRSILRAGYSWTTLLDLYKACVSPLQFRQELRDIDVKSSIARDIAWMITDMNLEQTGSRPYILKIKENMPPQEYIGYKSRRGYYFVLRVANKFPQCYLTLSDLEFSLQEHPIEVPMGFSLTQRLSCPESLTSPRSPGAFNFNNGDPGHLDDQEVTAEWLEEEEEQGDGGSEGETEDFLESYYQFQKKREAHHEHKITSFVMNVELNRSLLLNCMEEEGELDSGPGLTEEEQQRRAALWDSVRENLPKDTLSKTPRDPTGGLDRTEKQATNQRNRNRAAKLPNRQRGPRKGGGGRRRGHQELQRWNKRQRGASEEKENWGTVSATRVQGLPEQSVVDLPGASMDDVEEQSLGGGGPVGACSGPSGEMGDHDRVQLGNGKETICTDCSDNTKQEMGYCGCYGKNKSERGGPLKPRRGLLKPRGGPSKPRGGPLKPRGGTIGCHHGGGDNPKMKHLPKPVEANCGCLCHKNGIREELDPSKAIGEHNRYCSDKGKQTGEKSPGGIATCCGCGKNCENSAAEEDSLRHGSKVDADVDRIILVGHPSGLGVDIIYPAHWEAARKQCSLEEDLKLS